MFHSDGLKEAWDIDEFPGLKNAIYAESYRQFGLFVTILHFVAVPIWLGWTNPDHYNYPVMALDICSWCERRYQSLLLFDLTSAHVYAVVFPISMTMAGFSLYRHCVLYRSYLKRNNWSGRLHWRAALPHFWVLIGVLSAMYVSYFQVIDRERSVSSAAEFFSSAAVIPFIGAATAAFAGLIFTAHCAFAIKIIEYRKTI